MSKRGICINLEGVDGVGKTTTVQELAKKLNAVVVKTPPDAIASLRSLCAGSKNEYLRYHYYMMGNYMAGEEIEQYLSEGRNVILDRYYGSTMAYMWALKKMEFTGDTTWPQKLLKPDYMFLLNLDRQARINRLARRNDENNEERIIRQSEQIEADILKYYHLFGCEDIFIEENDSVEAVCEKVMNRIKLPVS
jgi:dTMP kinase